MCLCLLSTANILDQEVKFAERYGFLALQGVVLIVAPLAATAGGTVVRRCVTTGAISILVACAAISLYRGQYYENEIAFCRQWVRTDPQSPLAHNNLASAYFRAKRLDEAVGHYERALVIEPRYYAALLHLGDLWFQRGKFEKAISYYQRTLEAMSQFRFPPSHRRMAYRAHQNLAKTLMAQGQVGEAIAHFRHALQLQTGSHDAFRTHFKLGKALGSKGYLEQAIHHYREALRRMPDHVRTHFALGVALARTG